MVFISDCVLIDSDEISFVVDRENDYLLINDIVFFESRSYETLKEVFEKIKEAYLKNRNNKDYVCDLREYFDILEKINYFLKKYSGKEKDEHSLLREKKKIVESFLSEIEIKKKEKTKNGLSIFSVFNKEGGLSV